jgi:phosphatidylinositol glycan class C protein
MRRARQLTARQQHNTRNYCGLNSLVSDTDKANWQPHLTIPVPDNYTDEATFLDHLQRNPRLQPYEFWSLMSDATVIVQHLASVVVFCCCFVAIIQGRVSPVAVVVWASLCSVLAWALWDYWMGLSHSSEKDGSDTYASTRSTRRYLATAKSAALIYAALLGLSPILKSLTRSTTSDSIWALSTWLLLINVAFFDYSGGPGTQ